MSASALHRWVWDAARSLWQSNFRRDAVAAVARKVTAEAQNKVGNRKHSDRELFNIVFAMDRKPKPGLPRFILPGDDETKTADSERQGVRALAEACYALLRNPITHNEIELGEQEALEQLAVFSILAKWVEGSAVQFHEASSDDE